MEHISVSQLSMYLSCRLKYSLWKTQTKEEREADTTPAMARGRELHTKIENFYRLAPSKRPVAPEKKTTAGMDDAEKMWHHFLTQFGRDEDIVPTDVEMPLKMLILPGVELVGYADHVTVRSEEATISFGEHKTSSRKMNLRQTAYYSFQPLVYQMMLQEMYPSYTVLDVTYTGLWPNGADRVVRPLFDLGSWPRYFKLLAAEMINNPAPIPTGMALFPQPCGWCQFKDYCAERLAFGEPEEGEEE